MEQLSLGLIIQHFCSLIEHLSGGSQKKKDIFACIIIIEIGLFIGTVVAILKHAINPLGEYINQLLKVLADIKTASIIEIKAFEFVDYSTIEVIKLGLLQFSLFLSVLLLNKLKVKRSFILLWLIFCQVVGTSILFKEARSIVLLLVVFFCILDIFIPFGSGKYYKAVTYLRYFPEFPQKQSKSKNYWRKLFLELIVLAFLFDLAFRNLIPFISFQLSIVLYITIILFIWMNKPTARIELIFKKIIIYSLFIPFILLKDNSFSKNINTAIIVLISIFFSIDRVVALFKELKKYIEENSILYLLEADCDKQIFLKDILDIDKIAGIKLSAESVLRQIILHEKLDMPDTIKWINFYRSNNYDLELHVVNSIEYYLTIDEKVSLSDREEILSKIYKPNGGISFIPLLVEYANVLFLQDKNYEKIVEIVELCGININNETKYILHKAYLKTNNINAALYIKNEIYDFETIQTNMEEWQNNYKQAEYKNH